MNHPIHAQRALIPDPWTTPIPLACNAMHPATLFAFLKRSSESEWSDWLSQEKEHKLALAIRSSVVRVLAGAGAATPVKQSIANSDHLALSGCTGILNAPGHWKKIQRDCTPSEDISDWSS